MSALLGLCCIGLTGCIQFGDYAADGECSSQGSKLKTWLSEQPEVTGVVPSDDGHASSDDSHCVIDIVVELDPSSTTVDRLVQSTTKHTRANPSFPGATVTVDGPNSTMRVTTPNG